VITIDYRMPPIAPFPAALDDGIAAYRAVLKTTPAKNVAFVGTKAFWRPQDESPSGQSYHWNTNAETYYLIGEAMGRGMLSLLPAKPAKP
jgi:hypothetical protein